MQFRSVQSFTVNCVRVANGLIDFRTGENNCAALVYASKTYVCTQQDRLIFMFEDFMTH